MVTRVLYVSLNSLSLFYRPVIILAVLLLARHLDPRHFNPRESITTAPRQVLTCPEVPQINSWLCHYRLPPSHFSFFNLASGPNASAQPDVTNPASRTVSRSNAWPGPSWAHDPWTPGPAHRLWNGPTRSCFHGHAAPSGNDAGTSNVEIDHYF